MWIQRVGDDVFTFLVGSPSFRIALYNDHNFTLISKHMLISKKTSETSPSEKGDAIS